MRYLSPDQVDSLKRDGYLIIKGVFTKEEVEQVKSLASNFCGLNDYKASPVGDAMSLDGMADFLLDERFVNIAKDVLGEEVIYFGDSTLHCKPNERIFHKDARSDFADPGRSEYPIYRMGIFFQDHVGHSGGIKFRRGSHKKVLLAPNFLRQLLSGIKGVVTGKLAFSSLMNTGEVVNARSEIGDVVIWNLRTDHSGGAVLLKDAPDKALLPSEDEKVPDEKKLPEHETRMAIFSAFAAPSDATEAYTLDRVNNPAYKEHWKASHFDDPGIQALAKKRGITLDTRGIDRVKDTVA